LRLFSLASLLSPLAAPQVSCASASITAFITASSILQPNSRRSAHSPNTAIA